MYGYIGGSPGDYTERDKRIIKKIYGGTAENVQYNINFDDETTAQSNNQQLLNPKTTTLPFAKVVTPKYVTFCNQQPNQSKQSKKQPKLQFEL